eukprot:s1430_g20.t1
MIACDGSAFALIRSDGSVVTWGDANYGADSSLVQPLTEVRQICGSQGAFAALKANGRVVAWGNPEAGGEVPLEVEEKLRDVRRLQATTKAFCAVRADGQVVTWGSTSASEAQHVEEHLFQVRSVASTDAAFAALRRDGQVVCWGFQPFGGGNPNIGLIDLGGPVVEIVGNGCAFAALKEDGTIRTWGVADHGGEVPHEKQEQLKDVQSIAACYLGFCALRADGRVVCWGFGFCGDPGEVAASISSADLVVASAFAFARPFFFAMWLGVSSPHTAKCCTMEQLFSVQQVSSSQHGFVALRSDGRLLQWGEPKDAGPSEGDGALRGYGYGETGVG